MPSKPRGSKSASSRARDRFTAMHGEIRERICLLRYPPGMHLGEEALAGEFGVSRTPIRKVFNRLEAEGLVESRHGVGTVVTNIDLARLEQVYALRMRLAELVGDLDPRRPRGDELAQLHDLLDRCRRLLDAPDASEFCRINMAFHQALARLIGNVALREVTEMLYYQTARFFLHSIDRVDLLQEIDIFGQEMADIVGALERNDPRAVGFYRRNHIAHSFHRMTRDLQPKGPRAGAAEGVVRGARMSGRPA